MLWFKIVQKKANLSVWLLQLYLSPQQMTPIFSVWGAGREDCNRTLTGSWEPTESAGVPLCYSNSILPVPFQKTKLFSIPLDSSSPFTKRSLGLTQRSNADDQSFPITHRNGFSTFVPPSDNYRNRGAIPTPCIVCKSQRYWTNGLVFTVSKSL